MAKGKEDVPDGALVAGYIGAGEARTVLLLDSATAAEAHRISSPNLTTLGPFSPDGRWLVAAVDRGVRLWDVATGREIVRLLGELPWSSAAFSPDGRAIVALGIDGSVWWWDLAGVVGGGN